MSRPVQINDQNHRFTCTHVHVKKQTEIYVQRFDTCSLGATYKNIYMCICLQMYMYYR